MSFRYEAAYSGNSQFVIKTALQTLLPLGFKIIDQTVSALIVEGPGYNSTRQNALLGISRGELSFSRLSISINAELGGVDRMARFLLILLLGMGAIQAIIFTGLWFYVDRLHAQPWFLVIPALVFLPWIFIAPLMTKWISRRCEEALIRLVDNLAVLRPYDQH
ncbi:MAG: hypothetical protein Q7J07_09280 [Pelolinea sp.]|nr:hypothetical protein [Pelolinea sp.]